MTCSDGATMYEYDKTSVDVSSIAISQDDSLQNVTEALMRPSSGLTSTKETTLRLKLTPMARKSNIYISVVTDNAETFTVTTDNADISCQVSYQIISLHLMKAWSIKKVADLYKDSEWKRVSV